MKNSWISTCNSNNGCDWNIKCVGSGHLLLSDNSYRVPLILCSMLRCCVLQGTSHTPVCSLRRVWPYTRALVQWESARALGSRSSMPRRSEATLGLRRRGSADSLPKGTSPQTLVSRGMRRISRPHLQGIQMMHFWPSFYCLSIRRPCFPTCTPHVHFNKPSSQPWCHWPQFPECTAPSPSPQSLTSKSPCPGQPPHRTGCPIQGELHQAAAGEKDQ